MRQHRSPQGTQVLTPEAVSAPLMWHKGLRRVIREGSRLILDDLVAQCHRGIAVREGWAGVAGKGLW